MYIVTAYDGIDEHAKDTGKRNKQIDNTHTHDHQMTQTLFSTHTHVSSITVNVSCDGVFALACLTTLVACNSSACLANITAATKLQMQQDFLNLYHVTDCIVYVLLVECVVET
jgi:chaperone required for assembly of F1-ATPase